MLSLVTGKELEGRYVVQGVVGSGGYGTVWRAVDKQLNRDVALKRLLKTGIHSPDHELEVLLAEARKHAQLVHTNIVQVYDVIESAGEHLIVMEYVDGPSLQTLLREHARHGQVLAMDKAISILREILSGMSFAHDKLIVHRDLSPPNILLTKTQGAPPSFRIDRQASDPVKGSLRRPRPPLTGSSACLRMAHTRAKRHAALPGKLETVTGVSRVRGRPVKRAWEDLDRSKSQLSVDQFRGAGQPVEIPVIHGPVSRGGSHRVEVQFDSRSVEEFGSEGDRSY